MFYVFTIILFDSSFCEPQIPSYIQVEDYDLIQVQIVSRHGARTPLHLSKSVSNLWECSNTEISSYFNSPPIHVQVAFGRSIFLGNCHFGQLLQSGVESLIQIGKFFRSVYVDQLKFLPNKFNHKFFKFRSTNTLRTIHSMISIIRGFYPNESIDIETCDKVYDQWRRTSLLCPQFQRDFGQLILLENTSFKDEISNILQIKWSSANDIITSALCNNYTQPSSLLSEKVDQAILVKTREIQFVYSHDSIFPKFFSFCAAEMVNEMSLRIAGKSKLRFIHWSVHDGNILAFLGLLNYTVSKWPPYGSFIITELFKHRVNHSFFLQFRFNGEIIRIPRFNNLTLVPLEEFSDFLFKHIPDLEEKCAFDRIKFQERDLLSLEVY